MLLDNYSHPDISIYSTSVVISFTSLIVYQTLNLMLEPKETSDGQHTGAFLSWMFGYQK